MKININFKNDIKEMYKDGSLLFSIDDYLNGSQEINRKENTIGSLNCKIKNIPGFIISELDNIFYNNTLLSGFSTTPMLTMNYILEGGAEYSFKNRNISIKAGKTNAGMLDMEKFEHSGYKKNVYYKVFKIVFQNDTVEEYAHKYPDILGAAYTKLLKGEPFMLSNEHSLITSDVMNIISQIRHANLMGSASSIYIEAKILELLALQLQQEKYIQLNNNNQNRCKSINDYDRIHEAKRLLLINLDQTPTIPELSKHVGINECKLKYGFRELYNKTVFECLFDYKMELASKLLLDTSKTILEIAFDCGYGHPSQLITAFKKKYGLTPKTFRNKVQ